MVTLSRAILSDGYSVDEKPIYLHCLLPPGFQGLYLYNNTLAVLSVQTQTIHIMIVEDNGKLIDVRSIGKRPTQHPTTSTSTTTIPVCAPIKYICFMYPIECNCDAHLLLGYCDLLVFWIEHPCVFQYGCSSWLHHCTSTHRWFVFVCMLNNLLIFWKESYAHTFSAECVNI